MLFDFYRHGGGFGKNKPWTARIIRKAISAFASFMASAPP